MKRLIAITLLMGVAGTALADQYVQGHTRSDGTYVQGYTRSNANTVKYDNYGSQGNTNPYTGEKGTQRSEFSPAPAYNTGKKANCYYNCKD
jgi:hypothetical protein